MRIFFLLFLFIIWFVPDVTGQTTSVGASASSTDTNRIDTNYITFYKDKLILALWQSGRSFDISIAQKMVADSGLSKINYIANSNQVSGISLDYDIIGFAFGYRSLPGTNKRTGSTNYLDLGLNINTRSLRFENSYKRYTGFYDKNSNNYVIPFNDTTHYFQNPSMTVKIIKSKVIYSFKKKKFALGAAYANAKRQMKSCGSWLLVGNFYALNMRADSSIIPTPLQSSYGGWGGLNKLNLYAYSAGGGYSHTFVIWKRVYFNFLIAAGLETQYRHYFTSPDNNHVAYWRTWFASDWRSSLGYNGKRFFMRLTNIVDINNYESSDLEFKMQFIAVSFDFGYRFNFKTPRPYRKFQETKIYKML